MPIGVFKQSKNHHYAAVLDGHDQSAMQLMQREARLVHNAGGFVCHTHDGKSVTE